MDYIFYGGNFERQYCFWMQLMLSWIVICSINIFTKLVEFIWCRIIKFIKLGAFNSLPLLLNGCRSNTRCSNRGPITVHGELIEEFDMKLNTGNRPAEFLARSFGERIPPL